MAKKTKPMWQGVKLLCPCCGETAAVINLDLSKMDCTCESCGDTFSPEVACSKIKEHLDRWQAVSSWIATARDYLAPVQRDCDALPLPDCMCQEEVEAVANFIA